MVIKMCEARINQPSSGGDLPVDGRQCPEGANDGTRNAKLAVFIKSSPEATPALNSQFSNLNSFLQEQEAGCDDEKRIV